MILHPGILALLAGSGITLALLAAAAVTGLRILIGWDLRSSSEEQLALERKTYLVSTLVRYGLLFEVLSVFLFIYTADELHHLLVGAMCATGSLNANPYGFPALYAKVASLFLSSAWIALHHLDSKAEDYPLIRLKYKLLFFVIPFVLAGYVLEVYFFGAVDPSVITSCCGVLFSEGGSGGASSLASLPVSQTRIAFYAFFVLTAGAGIGAAKTGGRTWMAILPVFSVLFLLISVAAVISFISPYYYQLPTHHCPFDLLQSNYHYVGYPLYLSLFAGSFFGVMAGAVGPLGKIPSLSHILAPVQRRWALLAVLALSVFVILSTAPMVFTTFNMEGY